MRGRRARHAHYTRRRCAHHRRNGEKLRDAVRFIARGWIENGFAPAEFADYLADETRVSFPRTMIDKIVPRPDAEIARQLAEHGIEGM